MSYKIHTRENIKIIYIIFVLIFFFHSLLSFLLGKKLPNATILLSVNSSSMEPTIKKHSIIIVKHDADYQINDIITFRSTAKYNQTGISTTHRVIDKKGFNQEQLYFLTQGDNNVIADGWIAQSEVIGKVIYSFPPVFGRLVISSRNNIMCNILIFWFPVVLIMIVEGKKILKEVV